MVIVEKNINIDFVRVLRELFDLQFAEPRELMLAVAKILSRWPYRSRNSTNARA